MVQGVAKRAHHQLQRALGHRAGLDHDANGMLGYLCSGRGRFHDCGHTGQKRGAQFLKHAPHREVEGVDMHRAALERRVNVLADEAAGLANGFVVAIDKNDVGRQLPPGFRGHGEKGTGATFYIDPPIITGCASLCRQLVQFFLPGDDGLRQCLEHPATFVEVHCTQGRTANSARMVKHCCKIQAFTAGDSYCVTIDR